MPDTAGKSVVEKRITCKNQRDHGISKTSISEVKNVIKGSNGQVLDLPTTAKPIQVMSIKDPYIIRIYELGERGQALQKLSTKLWTFVAKMSEKEKDEDAKDAKIGDMVLIESNNELPSFICRGVITYIKEKDGIYYILLVDHGTSIKLTRDKFRTVSQDFIPDKYLSKAVGVYNILPTRVKKGFNNSKPAVDIVEKWSEEAIQFIKNILVASQIVYFNRLLTDEKNGREYGEFYCIIDDKIVTLSKALIINYHAIYLEKELLQLIENPSNTEYKENTGEHIIYIKFSNMEITKPIQFVNEISDSLNDFCLREKILIHGTTNCRVFNNVSNLNYPSKLYEGWNIHMKSLRPTKLQSYMWPAINKGLNVVGIGPSQCGKTCGCIMAVCGLVAMRKNEISHSPSPAPLALILCSSSFEVINVHSLCMSYLHTLNDVKSVAAFTGKTDRSIMALMYNGCEILVSTPRYLVRFLNNNKNLLSFDRLSCLVLDNADVILDKYYNSLGVLFKKHNIIKNREPQGDNRPILQTIISATHWTSEIKKFVHLAMYNPYICISSFLEGIVFKSVHPKLYILKSTQKNKKIADILKNDYKALKTMIICINAEEAEQLNTFLLSIQVETLLIHEKMKNFDIEIMRKNWEACKCGLYPVLICTDEILSQLNCLDIQWLIHHSVQLKWKNVFNYRFSVLLKDLTQEITNSKVSIFIDETNNVQLPSIIRLMQRMKVVITPELLESVERIAIALERDKKCYALCDNVKLFGFCQKKNICEFRHCMLPKIDAPITNIQINDKVKLTVMYIHDTTHFSARIIDHIPQSDESKKITFSNVEYMQTACKMQQYYQNVENRKMCASTDVGDFCVLEESFDIFKRVQIRRIKLNRGTSEDVKFVDVKCIDSGIIHENVDARKLLHIPEELLNLSTHIVEVFLAGIAPHDEEYIWNYYTNQAVHKWFSENFDEKSYIIGKVCFHLGNTIWLDDFEIGTKLIDHADVIGASLKKALIDGNCAVPNDNHISDLFKLYKKSELTEISDIA